MSPCPLLRAVSIPPSLQTEAPHRIFTKEFGLIWDIFPKSVRSTLCCLPATNYPQHSRTAVTGQVWSLWSTLGTLGMKGTIDSRHFKYVLNISSFWLTMFGQLVILHQQLQLFYLQCPNGHFSPTLPDHTTSCFCSESLYWLTNCNIFVRTLCFQYQRAHRHPAWEEKFWSGYWGGRISHLLLFLQDFPMNV